jgi:dGTP triphosphohydrolase
MPKLPRDRRLHKANPHVGHRTPFRRDRDSIFYCNFFRRLAGVTQVVHVAEGHIFHNRLVHSLKVAQIGMVLGRGCRSCCSLIQARISPRRLFSTMAA